MNSLSGTFCYYGGGSRYIILCELKFAITIHEFMKLSGDNLKEIGVYSLDAPQTRKSLVKGERFIRSVWRA